MKKGLRIVCLMMVLVLFTVFAIGSGSEKASENKGDTEPATGTNEKASEAAEAEYTIGDTVASVSTDSIGSKYIQVYFTVKNTGKVNLFLESGSADIENSSGSLEDTVDMISAYPNVIKPGETGYYYERTLYDGDATSGLKAIAHPDVEKASVDCIRYSVSDVSVKDEQYSGAKVIGRVENTTDEKSETVEVAAILFDKNNKLIGVEYTYLDDGLAAGDKRAFECSPLRTDLKASNIATYKVYAYPNQYNW